MRDRPSDVGMRPFGDEGTEPFAAPPPNNTPIMAAALGPLRDASKSRLVLDPVRHFFICGASTNGLSSASDSDVASISAFRRCRRQACSRRWASSISSAPSPRAGCRIATTIEAVVLVLRAARPVAVVPALLRFHASTACRCSRCSTGSTDRHRATEVRLTAQRFGPERANLVFGWIFAGHQLGAGVAAFGAGLSRRCCRPTCRLLRRRALCIVAALIVLAISRPKPVVAAA